MSTLATRRSESEKVAIFRECFTGLTHVYGTYDVRSGRVRQVKGPVTHRVLLSHLCGRQPYGVYLLVADRTRAVVADFDEEDMGPPLQFLRRAKHYGLSAYLERSKSKGWHAWMFTEVRGVPAAKARLVVKAILSDIQTPATEVFPKQDRLVGDARYGNFINAPLFGALVLRGRTVFVDPDNGFQPYVDQWDLLAGVQRASESQLDDIIATNALTMPNGIPANPVRRQTPSATGSRFGLPPCARRMLAEGVTCRQRVSCFRLALHLKRAGLPQDIIVASLVAWAAKNRPQNGKPIIDKRQIAEQTGWAFKKDYCGCGCEDPAVGPYCDPQCPILNGRESSCAADGKRAFSTSTRAGLSADKQQEVFHGI
jgi:hypothetical protein